MAWLPALLCFQTPSRLIFELCGFHGNTALGLGSEFANWILSLAFSPPWGRGAVGTRRYGPI